jgi:hypothetical protein
MPLLPLSLLRTCVALAACHLSPADAQPEDAALQHQRAKEMLQLTEWMAAVGQGHKDMLVRAAVVFFAELQHCMFSMCMLQLGCTASAQGCWRSSCSNPAHVLLCWLQRSHSLQWLRNLAAR